ncbi:MAG: hypothetical protein KZQ77_09445, partial [Candidatus Thiodiazotropha sp. (ex Notomyrtea botanica)]|nr:hypothetical protein [Candidatus Thiodiazotropha sp. (ex Notomyrtea botanica)]
MRKLNGLMMVFIVTLLASCSYPLKVVLFNNSSSHIILTLGHNNEVVEAGPGDVAVFNINYPMKMSLGEKIL